MLRQLFVVVLSVICYSLSLAANATDPSQPFKQDLTTCELPHGDLVLPDRNTEEAKAGYIFDFSGGKLKPLPQAEQPTKSVADMLQRIRDNDAGDLIFSRLKSGMFLAVSTRIADLGSSPLSAFDGRQLDRPEPVESRTERSAAGEPSPGVLEGLEQQHCYLVETVDAKYALVRVIYIDESYAHVQYVYQPDGTRTFRIPGTKHISVDPPKAKEAATSRPSPAALTQLTDGAAVLEARGRVVAELMRVVKAPAQTPDQQFKKASAIRMLGLLRAVEAVGLLLEEVAFSYPIEPSRELTVAVKFPAVAALERIGKPSSVAAVEMLASIQYRGADIEVDQRVRLLATVVRNVEGDEVGVFMLERRAAKVAPEQRGALTKALECIKTP